MAQEIFKSIDQKIKANKGNKKLVEVLEQLKKDIETLLP